MNAQTETFEEEDYEEFDEFDEDEEERGLSGLVVLLMGVVMLGAFASVVWIAYQQGLNNRPAADIPTVTADPEPIKIENDVAAAAADDRPVYDRVSTNNDAPVEVIAEGPEEPMARDLDDPIGAIASEVAGASDGAVEIVDDAVADRINELAAADAALDNEPVIEEPATPAPAARPEPAPAAATPAISTAALSGSHLVQVGAFRSDAEAMGYWDNMRTKLGGYLDGKATDIERADLGDRGVFHRLRVGPFATSDAAKTFCEGLKSRGQDCLVKAK